MPDTPTRIFQMSYRTSQYCLACSRLSDSGEDAKVKGTRKVGSFLPFYFRLRAFLIQRARLSRSQEQAKYCLEPRCVVEKAFILLDCLGTNFRYAQENEGSGSGRSFLGGLLFPWPFGQIITTRNLFICCLVQC